MVKVPPMAWVRSRIPITPKWPAGVASAISLERPTPLSSICIRSCFIPYCTSMSKRVASACCRTLATASSAIFSNSNSTLSGQRAVGTRELNIGFDRLARRCALEPLRKSQKQNQRCRARSIEGSRSNCVLPTGCREPVCESGSVVRERLAREVESICAASSNWIRFRRTLRQRIVNFACDAGPLSEHGTES